MPAMQFISSSLGVECTFCHVQGSMESDDKGPKSTAREMMAMTANINKEAFKGQRQVTCYSCHHGVRHPVAMPPVLEADLPARPAAAPAPPAAGAPQVTADQIIEKYITALGGADALMKVNTRVMTGVTIVNGGETPIEIFTKAPNKRISIASGSSYTAFDGSLSSMGSRGSSGARVIGLRIRWRQHRRGIFAGPAHERNLPAIAPRPPGNHQRRGV